MRRKPADGGSIELTPEQWERLDALLPEALALPAEARGAFLDGACEGDAVLRAELAALIVAADRTGILDRPLTGLAGAIADRAHAGLATGTSSRTTGSRSDWAAAAWAWSTAPATCA